MVVLIQSMYLLEKSNNYSIRNKHPNDDFLTFNFFIKMITENKGEHANNKNEYKNAYI